MTKLLPETVWTYDNVVAPSDVRAQIAQVSAELNTSRSLQRYSVTQDLLARSMVEALEAVATDGTTLSKAIPNLTIGAVKSQLESAPKTVLMLTAQRGLEESLAKFRQLDPLIPPKDSTALDAAEFANITSLCLQARTLELPNEVLASKLMPTRGSDLTSAALKSAMSELTSSPLFTQPSSAAVTVQNLIDLEARMTDLAQLPAFKDYSNSLALALNQAKANEGTIANWAKGASQQCSVVNVASLRISP